eukprot:symbB.v1.2.016344.t1/scaffold1222.1/size194531/18
MASALDAAQEVLAEFSSFFMKMTSTTCFCLFLDNEPDLQVEANEEVAVRDEAHGRDGGAGGLQEIEEEQIEEEEEVEEVAALAQIQEPAAGSEDDQLTVLETIKAALSDVLF